MTEKILQHLKAKKSSPTVEYLQQIMTAYCSSVPWESVSKIVKKELAFKTSDCLRLEEEFWTSSFQFGTGGTCYESNWAFFCFLQSLGFEGYLTINKIIDKSSAHTAIVIIINSKKYIVDIGFPTYTLFLLLKMLLLLLPMICLDIVAHQFHYMNIKLRISLTPTPIFIT